jgi:uncharacterized membrane protein
MKPLFVLLSVFVVSLVLTKIFRGNFEFAMSGKIAMSIMLLFTAMAHFVFTKGMSLMLPAFIPFKTELVYLTGFIEIICAIGLFIPVSSAMTAWILIAFFILIIPANINAAIQHLDYQKGTFDGSGLSYLWLRIPLQVIFICWTYFSFIKR